MLSVLPSISFVYGVKVVRFPAAGKWENDGFDGGFAILEGVGMRDRNMLARCAESAG